MLALLYYSPSLFNAVKRNLRNEREGCQVFDLKISGFTQPVVDKLVSLLSLQLLRRCAVDRTFPSEDSDAGVGVS